MDFSEVNRLSADLGRAPKAVIAEAGRVLFKASMNIKDDVQQELSGHTYWSPLARAMDFELVGLKSEVGFKDQGQGELAGIAEFGSARHAPHPALVPASEAEADRFVQALADAAEKLL